jgi:hypothetical protein
MNSYSEIEKIWEAYKALLVDEARKNAEDQVNKDRDYVANGINLKDMIAEDNFQSYKRGQTSNLDNIISIQKLILQGKMYMNPDEIEVISQGKLKEYLSQFDSENSDDYMQFGGFDL